MQIARKLTHLVSAELGEVEDVAVVHHDFLLALDGDALAVLAPPDDFRRRKSISPARHINILIFTNRHR